MISGSYVRIAGALLCGALTVFVAGCSDSTTTPTPSPTFSETDLRLGTGTEAAAGKVLTVNYTGWLYDGTKTDHKGLQFDTSVGLTPLAFTLGAGQVIDGWERGLPGMKAGGVRQLVIPPSLAYGGARNGPIPPFATLIFEIELVDVQ